MKKIAYMLKSSRVLYSIYYYSMSALFKVLGLFVRTDNHLILFNSYGGKKYDDNPKAVFERMQNDPRFERYKLVWALQEPEKAQLPEGIPTVKADTFRFFITALKARVWVTNSSMERGLDFKKKQTICINTWHGTAIKVMGIDIKEENQSFRSKILARADIMLAQSQYDIDTFSHAFQLPKDHFRLTGAPRNDILANYTTEQTDAIREKLGISKEKMVLLYAPTFREYTKGANNEVILNAPMDLKHWQEVLSDRYVVLFRAHYEVARSMNVAGYSCFIDVSNYPNLNELMIISDALISDYSSIYFDYAVMHKPMYNFSYDYDEYMAHRGMYLSLKDELPCVIHKDENSLLVELLELKEKRAQKQAETIRFQQKYVTEYGRAAEKCCDVIYSMLMQV